MDRLFGGQQNGGRDGQAGGQGWRGHGQATQYGGKHQGYFRGQTGVLVDPNNISQGSKYRYAYHRNNQ